MFKALRLNIGYCSVWESLHRNPINWTHKSINCVKKDDIIVHHVAKRDSGASLYYLLVKSLQSFEYKQSRFRQQIYASIRWLRSIKSSNLSARILTRILHWTAYCLQGSNLDDGNDRPMEL